MDIILIKLLLFLAMFVLTLFVGLMPIKVLSLLRHSAAVATSSREHKNVSLILCLLTCFSGGVFLGTCFLHLFPELQETWNAFNEDFHLDIHYPIAELISCIGFFLLFFLEEVVIMAMPSFAHGAGHGHSHGQAHGHQPVDTDALIGASQSGGCCLVPGASEQDKGKQESTPLNVLNDEEVHADIERGSIGSETQGHCRTHCALTVHSVYRRGNSQEKPSNCKMVSTELCTAVILAEPERCETNCEKVDEDPPILMASKPHAHSHGVRSITFVAALSFHSIVEGVALGITNSPTDAYTLFFSLMVHKLIVAFSVGLQLARTHAHALYMVVISMLILASMSPLGALFGMIVQNTIDGAFKEALMTIFQGLAVGTFIYVTFFEVLLHERDNEHPNLLKLVFMLLGFTMIGAVRLFDDGHGHGHSHGAGGAHDEHDHVNAAATTAATVLANATAAVMTKTLG
ncbi:unnamed protein product, partial [Mesorhabditis belari]|uniref:Zinc transporter ZIP1 n=1 Tax=Mesorhabditis belari TaxID=2138241 RepID=A0AAF3FAQ5_9BILA